MKHAFVLPVALLTLGFAATALSAPPAKSSILHCGCAEDGLSMVYKEISVSSKSSGHDAHVATSPDSCFVGVVEDVEIYFDFVRTGSDCQLSGPPLGDPIADCSTFEDPGPVAGDTCGEELLD